METLRAFCFAYILLLVGLLFRGLWRDTENDDSVFAVGLVALVLLVVSAFILYR